MHEFNRNKYVERTFTYTFEEENEDTDIIAIQKNISQKRTNNDVTLNTNNNNMITIENGIKNTTTEEMLALPLNNKTPEKSFDLQLMIKERGYISESVSEVSFSTTDEENLSFEKSSLSSSEDSDELEDDDESRIESDWLHSQEQGFEEEPWVDITDEIPDFAENTLDCKILLPTDNKTPIEIYDLFVTEEIINKMVKETNDYAEKYLVDNAHTIKQKSRVKPTNFEEMRQFFGVILIMSLNKVPHLNDYWSRKSIYRNDYICSLFSRDRFLLILKFWHFSELSVKETDDKLHKFRGIYESFNSRFQCTLEPGKLVVIDETMIPWRGRLKFQQYIKNKSHKYGVKIYKLCTPEGYTYRMIVYTGKEANKREQDHGLKTVMNLVAGLEDAGRTVVADNFYSSIKLAELLLTRKTFYCGTLRSNRKGVPKKLYVLK
ncbi:unnamed protein product [Arctia plantaginis]|uniref:PiggyBac transposable element-derived protein domain-containing protein n=1 Tax=Arctia plantaginis TaxID=874455 RepID=A0A8S1AGV5_ARCPL|nr:unnamed protein product [Arctia plantaginis]